MISLDKDITKGAVSNAVRLALLIYFAAMGIITATILAIRWIWLLLDHLF